MHFIHYAFSKCRRDLRVSVSECDIIIIMLLISESTAGPGSWCDIIIIIMLLIPESTEGPGSWCDNNNNVIDI